jgi:hypothetical protein
MSDTFEAFDCYGAGVIGEPGVGITVYTDCGRWLSWDDTVALHAWLTKLIDAEKCITLSQIGGCKI